jgi:hypothetical protein
LNHVDYLLKVSVNVGAPELDYLLIDSLLYQIGQVDCLCVRVRYAESFGCLSDRVPLVVNEKDKPVPLFIA